MSASQIRLNHSFWRFSFCLTFTYAFVHAAIDLLFLFHSMMEKHFRQLIYFVHSIEKSVSVWDSAPLIFGDAHKEKRRHWLQLCLLDNSRTIFKTTGSTFFRSMFISLTLNYAMSVKFSPEFSVAIFFLSIFNMTGQSLFSVNEFQLCKYVFSLNIPNSLTLDGSRIFGSHMMMRTRLTKMWLDFLALFLKIRNMYQKRRLRLYFIPKYNMFCRTKFSLDFKNENI